MFAGCPTDHQMDCVAKLAPLVAMYAGREDLLQKAEAATRVTQDDDIAVAVGRAYAR